MSTGQCLVFKVAYGIIPEMPELSDSFDESAISRKELKPKTVYENLAEELNKRLSELQTIIDKQILRISEIEKESKDQQQQIAELKKENIKLAQDASCIKGELKTAKEREYAAQAKCKALESQLQGSEAARKQLEEDSSVIGELQADVEDLKTALTVSRKNNEKLQTDITQYQETIKRLQGELRQSHEDNQKLHTTIETQKSQIEAAQAAVKIAEEKNSLDKISQVSNEEKGQSVAEREQPTWRDVLSIGSILPRNKKILIIGGSETKESHLRGKLKSMQLAWLLSVHCMLMG